MKVVYETVLEELKMDQHSSNCECQIIKITHPYRKGGEKENVKMDSDLKCEILETLGEFREERGYHLELNLIKWGGDAPKYDLRRWNSDRSK